MLAATDRSTSRPPRWALATVTVLAVLAESGCSRLRSFRHDDRPVFGTYSPWDEPRSLDLGPEGALTGREGTPNAPDAGEAVAGGPATGAVASADAASAASRAAGGGKERPAVALQPPLTAPASPSPAPEAHEDARPRPASTAHASPAGPTRADDRRDAEPDITTILQKARQALDGLTTYQVVMDHQERVAGTLNPAEKVVMSIRRNPKAVRLEWPEGTNKGREVLYAADAHGGLMHVKMPPTPIPLPRLSIAPDSPLATRSSRHPITEAGFDTIVHNLESAYQRQQRSDHSLGTLRYEGLETPEGRTRPCYKVIRVTPSNETWTVYIDPASNLPAYVQAVAGNGDLLERYVFQEPARDLPELAKADAFDPDARWGPSKGLFQRLARGGDGESQENPVPR